MDEINNVYHSEYEFYLLKKCFKNDYVKTRLLIFQKRNSHSYILHYIFYVKPALSVLSPSICFKTTRNSIMRMNNKTEITKLNNESKRNI